MTNFNLSVSSRLYAKKKKKKNLLPEEEEPHFPSSSKVSLHVEIIETVTNLEHYRDLDKKAWNFPEPMEIYIYIYFF